MGKYCYVESARRRARRYRAPTGEDRGGGILCRHVHAQLVISNASRIVNFCSKWYDNAILLFQFKLHRNAEKN